jgi:hypothetical protein
MTTTAKETAYAIVTAMHGQYAPVTASLIETLDYLSLLHEVQGEISDLIAGAIASVRTLGGSWTDVGQALGNVSKQAAQQRYGPSR